MSWSDKYKRSINCDNPSGFSQKAHCAARKKRQKGEETKSKSPFNEMHEIKTHKSVEEIAKKHRLEVSFIQRQLEMGIPIEHEHTKDKDLATDIALQHLDEIPDYYTRLKKMEASAKKEHKKFKDVKEAVYESRRDDKRAGDPGYSLRDWFKGGGWVQVAGKYKGKPCAKQPGQTTKPFCRDADDAAAMSTAEKKRRTAKKRREDPNPERKGKAKMVREENCPICNCDPCQCLEGTLQEKKDACYHKVKSRYKVWPSAYASGALVKCRKVGADSWGTKTEAAEMIRYCPKCKKNESRSECKYGPRYWDTFSIPSQLSNVAMSNPHYHANSPHPGNMPEGYDHEYSMARSELSTIIAAAKRLKKKMAKGEGSIEAWVQSKITKAADYIDTAADYVDSGEMSEQIRLKEPTDKAAKEQLQKMIPKGEKIYTTPQTKSNLQAAHYEPEGDQLNENPLIGLGIRAGLAAGTALAGKAVYDKAKDVADKLQQRNQKMQKQIDQINQSYEPEGEIIDEAGKKCWPGYKKKGTQELFGKKYNRCVKAEGFSNWREELGLTEDWQSVNRKDKTDGLSQKAVDAYRRENPGSKLQTAVTEKKPKGKRAKRRKSFCSRSAGQRDMHNIDCSKTPDKPICKARRRWKC